MPADIHVSLEALNSCSCDRRSPLLFPPSCQPEQHSLLKSYTLDGHALPLCERGFVDHCISDGDTALSLFGDFIQGFILNSVLSVRDPVITAGCYVSRCGGAGASPDSRKPPVSWVPIADQPETVLEECISYRYCFTKISIFSTVRLVIFRLNY